jgi:hypothetical protein
MPEPLITAERYRKEAAEFSELAKTAETSFVRDYYRRIAQRYLTHAENQEKLARTSKGLGAGQHQQIAESPSVQPSPEAVLPEEASAAHRPASPTPSRSGYSSAGAPRRSRRRRPDP